MKTVLVPFFSTLVDKTKQHGKSVVLWCLIVLGFASMFFYFFKLNDFLLEKYIYQSDQKIIQNTIDTETKHMNNVAKRRDLNAKIQQELNRFFWTNDCVLNVALMEYHNGSENLLKSSFLFISNTFELCKSNDAHFGDIQRVNLSLFNISNKLYSNHGFYTNTIQNLKKDDMKLYSIVYGISKGKQIYILELNNAQKVGVAALVVISDEPYSEELKDKFEILKNRINILFTSQAK